MTRGVQFKRRMQRLYVLPDTFPDDDSFTDIHHPTVPDDQ